MVDVRERDLVLPTPVVAGCERARAIRAVRIASDARMVAGAIACRRTGCAWANVTVGLGLNGPVTAADIAELVAFYGDIGRDARVEVADRAENGVFALLADAGFRMRWPVSVLVRRLNPGDQNEPVTDPAGVRFEPVNPADSAAARQIACLLAESFAAPGCPVHPDDIAANAAQLQHAEIRGVVAYSGSRPIGAGFMDAREGVAALWGAAVAPDFRGRGVQTALLHRRVGAAIEDGAMLAVIETESGGPTHRNAARMGFRLGYSRTVLVRPRTL